MAEIRCSWYVEYLAIARDTVGTIEAQLQDEESVGVGVEVDKV